MLRRWVFLISFVGVSYYFGGAWLAFGAFMLVGLLGAMRPYHPSEAAYERQQEREQDRLWEVVETARRGSQNDPTRPDEPALLLTNVARRLP